MLFRSDTVVKLVGFREETFLGGLFEPVDKNEPKKCVKAGDNVRYIIKNLKSVGDFVSSDPCDILDYEAVYVVERVERHPSYSVLLFVKLVGIEGVFNRIWFEKVVN